MTPGLSRRPRAVLNLLVVRRRGVIVTCYYATSLENFGRKRGSKLRMLNNMIRCFNLKRDVKIWQWKWYTNKNIEDWINNYPDWHNKWNGQSNVCWIFYEIYFLGNIFLWLIQMENETQCPDYRLKTAFKNNSNWGYAEWKTGIESTNWITTKRSLPQGTGRGSIKHDFRALVEGHWKKWQKSTTLTRRGLGGWKRKKQKKFDLI